jgi:hypothetical protein
MRWFRTCAIKPNHAASCPPEQIYNPALIWRNLPLNGDGTAARLTVAICVFEAVRRGRLPQSERDITKPSCNAWRGVL